MGVFQKIRDNSLLSLILVGGSIFLFIIGDALTSGSFFISGNNEDVVGEVEGQEISLNDFNKALSEVKYISTNGQRNTDFSPKDLENLTQQTWNQLLLKNIMKKEGKHLGIDVVDEEFINMIAGQNPYPFYVYRLFGGPENYQQVQQQMIGNENEYYNYASVGSFAEAEMLKNFGIDLRKQEKFFEIIEKAAYATNSLAQNEYEKNKVSADIQLAKVPYYLINDSTFEITQEDIKKYYNSNKHQFKLLQPSNKIKFAVFALRPSKEDELEVQEWANQTVKLFQEETNDKLFVKQESEKAYDPTFYKKGGELEKRLDTLLFDKEKGFVYGPYVKFENGSKTYNVAKVMDKRMLSDSMLVSHIQLTPDKFLEGLMASGVQPTQEEINEAWQGFNAMVDSVYEVLDKDPSQFSKLAKEFSSDTVSAKDNGRIGWVKNDDRRFAQQFTDSVFINSNPGTSKKVRVALDNGYFYYHILKVDQEGPKSEKIQVGIVSRTVVPGNKTLDDYYKQASALAMKVNKGAPLDVYADSLTYYVDSAFVQMQQYTVRGLSDSRRVVNWAFNNETKIGKPKVFDLKEQYIVAYLSDVLDGDYLPLKNQEVQNRITGILRNEIRFNKIKEQLGENSETLLKDLEEKMTGASVQNYSNVGIKGVEGNTSEAALTGAILGLAEGETSNWIKGNNGAYIVKVIVKREEKANENTNLELEKEELKGSIWQVDAVLNELLQSKADVENNIHIVR